MKRKIYISILVVLAIILIAFFFLNKKAQAPQDNAQLTADNSRQETQNQQIQQLEQVKQLEQLKQLQPKTADPIDGAKARITKKPFGILIDKQNSPVQPERFSGYHTAVDLETNSDEQNVDVSVKALCEGKLLSARIASGYGGVAVQSCVLDGQNVTIIYGHIKLSSMSAKVGDVLKAGDFVADLGKGFSRETDGERKHLHLGIHKGQSVNILGYVGSQLELSSWIDPVKYLK